MQERVTRTHEEINSELLSFNLKAPMWYWGLVGFMGTLALGAAVSFGIMINRGMGVTGMNRPVMWGLFLTDFIF
jgi:hypothetical protein